jgi:hypothetical protein
MGFPIASDRTMNLVLQPWQLLFLILAGWVNRQQQQVIDYLRTENQILREKIGKRRILLDDNQRRRLAVKGKVLGRKVLAQVGTLVTVPVAFDPFRIVSENGLSEFQQTGCHDSRAVSLDHPRDRGRAVFAEWPVPAFMCQRRKLASSVVGLGLPNGRQSYPACRMTGQS